MILENNRKTFQELQNRIIGKILSIIASSLAVDIRDIIIIKFIVTYFYLSACSIHRYGEAVAHAHCKLKPRLLLSNHCNVEYLDLVLH